MADETEHSGPYTYIDRAVQALREVYDANLTARDEAVRILHEDMVRVPTLLDRAEQNITALLRGEIDKLEAVTNERFAAVSLRFGELEKRSKDLDEARATALAAALQAAKEAVGEQNRSNTTAISKSELAVGESIKQLQATFDAANRATNEKIDDLKSRLDRGEGGTIGERHMTSERRLDMSAIIALLALAGVFASIILQFVHHT
jgi:hypothetical protein